MARRYLGGGALLGALVLGASVGSAQILTGLELVEGEVSASVSFDKLIQLDCPPGKVVVGGGGGVSGPAVGGQTLYQTLPINDPPTSWVVVGRDVDGGGTVWGLRADVWCADPPPGLERVTALSDVTSFSPKAQDVACPPGKVALGAGVAIASSFATTVGINEITVLPNHRWRGVGVELLPDAGDWGVLTTVLCADVEPSQRLRSVFRSAFEYMSADSFCPDGTFPLAGGADVFPDDGTLLGSTIGVSFAPYWFVAASKPGSGSTVSELDITVLCHPDERLFNDDFESGGSGAWSVTVP